MAAGHAPESSDSEFTWEKFQARVNKDLADVLGNFVSRVTKFCRSKFGETVPEGGDYGARGARADRRPHQPHRRLRAHMEAIEVRKAAQELRGIWVAGNEYLQAAAPWSAFKTDPDRPRRRSVLALNLIPLYAVLSAAFIPDASAAMLASMNCDDARWPDDVATALSAVKPDHSFDVPEVLFAKITDEDREGWQARFAGVRV